MHIHVGRNIPGCEPDEYPGCFSSVENAVSMLRSLLNVQAGYYSDNCETPCGGGEDCPCEACECEWCVLSAVATTAAKDDSMSDKLNAGQNLRWRFDVPEGSDEEIWAHHQTFSRDNCELAESGN